MTPPVPRSGGAPARWDPLREFEDLYTQMGRLLETSFGQLTQPATGWLPLADVSETDDAYLVEVDLPGVKRNDIDIEVTGNELTITGELKHTERKGLFRKRTRRTGEFEYRTTLPREVDPDRIDATLTEGVLTVRIPKTDTAKRRRIQITGG